MKLTLLIIVWMYSSLFTLPMQSTHNNEMMNGNLTVLVDGLKKDKGFIQIGLFNSKESWDGKKEKYKGTIIPIKSDTVEWKVENIPFGDYAVKLFHDENGDNKLNTNFLGMPVERYGFSNNPAILFGPPSFEKAKIVFCSKDTSITVKLR
jgi:uncharacterized protein (DUF2141 family)